MQDIIVYLIVAGAAYYLGRMLWSAASGRKSSCNSCGSSCASQSKKPSSAPLLQIELKNLDGKQKK